MFNVHRRGTERMEEEEMYENQKKNVIRESNALAQRERKVFEGWGGWSGVQGIAYFLHKLDFFLILLGNKSFPLDKKNILR